MVGKDDKDGQIALLRKALEEVVGELGRHWYDDVRADDLCEDCYQSLAEDRYVGARHLGEVAEIAKSALLETTY